MHFGMKECIALIFTPLHIAGEIPEASCINKNVFKVDSALFCASYIHNCWVMLLEKTFENYDHLYSLIQVYPLNTNLVLGLFQHLKYLREVGFKNCEPLLYETRFMQEVNYVPQQQSQIKCLCFI